MDTISRERRSRNMSRIRGKDTSIEVRVRSRLHRMGFRFRKNDPRYPGKPDILLPRYRAAVFVNGCFWHHHEGCPGATVPKTNTDFWLEKFRRNRKNDRKNLEALETAGWRTFVLWECDLERDFEAAVEKLASDIRGEEKKKTAPER